MSTGLSRKVLLIVEGENLEPRFFSRLAGLFDLDVEIVSLRANIYRLYRKLKEYGFDYSVRVALTELIGTEEVAEILRQRFAYTYLVFDCDAQDSGLPSKGDERNSLEKTVAGNYRRLTEMVGYFDNETDPDRGKLYVNYPMMESYRDCDSFFDEGYAGNVIQINESLGRAYKQRVGQRKMASYRIDKLDRGAVSQLMRMQLFKLAKVLGRGWQAVGFDEYLRLRDQRQILSAQDELRKQGLMSVLNTSILLPVDYFEDRNDFYKRVSRGVVV